MVEKEYYMNFSSAGIIGLVERENFTGKCNCHRDRGGKELF